MGRGAGGSGRGGGGGGGAQTANEIRYNNALTEAEADFAEAMRVIPANYRGQEDRRYYANRLVEARIAAEAARDEAAAIRAGRRPMGSLVLQRLDQLTPGERRRRVDELLRGGR